MEPLERRKTELRGRLAKLDRDLQQLRALRAELQDQQADSRGQSAELQKSGSAASTNRPAQKTRRQSAAHPRSF
jgi:peptidoglycan hydrolase CwlO-like protein